MGSQDDIKNTVTKLNKKLQLFHLFPGLVNCLGVSPFNSPLLMNVLVHLSSGSLESINIMKELIKGSIKGWMQWESEFQVNHIRPCGCVGSKSMDRAIT